MRNSVLFFVFSLLMSISNIHAQDWIKFGQDIDGEAAGDYSGTSVSISSDGSILAIGSPNNHDNGLDAGQVRVYQNNSGTWTQIGQDIDGEAQGDNSGISVSLNSDGSIVAIGAYFNDENGTDSGHVRIYQNISGTWMQMGQDIDGETADDWSGMAVSLSSDGSIVAIGAGKNDGNGIDSGHVRVYQYISGIWTKIGQDIDGEAAGDEFGTSVSLNADGSIVAIGAPNNGSYAGHVRVYQNNSGTWVQIGQDIDGEAAYDMSGTSVSLSNDGFTLAIGAPRNSGNGSNSGQVRVYQYNAGVWTQIGQDIDGEAVDDMSGNSVSISDDGSIVAIGASRNDGNGSNSGHVRVYKNNSGTWTRIGSDINGEMTGDYFGYSLSLSSNGEKVAVGAPFNDGNGGVSGHVREYYLLYPPTITNQPINQINLCLGSNVSFTVTGTDIATYQWQVNEGTGFVNISNNSIYSGTKTATLSITGVTSAMDNFQYRCFVANAVGYALSNPATLTTDHQAPTVPTLPDVTGECSATATVPTTTDNCSGTISGTTTDPLTYTTQGTHVITWTFDDGNGNTATAIQNVIIDDTTSPTIPTLPNITGECTATAPVPTTTDNCSGTVSGTTTDPLTYTIQGTHVITWTFDDGNGNTSTAIQNVIIDDTTSPTIPTLPNITGECSATAPVPTTTDNCTGTVSGTTTDPLTYTTQGTHVITWSFDDGNGNIVTTTQNVIIDDVTNPTITCSGNQTINLNQGETFYTVSGTEFDPTAANDNCNVASVVNDFNNTSTLAGEHIPIGSTTIEWTVTDGSGNEMTCSFNISVNEYVSIAELVQVGISIYPNPSNGEFTIENANDYEITIMDITGKLVYQANKAEDIVSRRVRLQQSGVYIINFKSKTKNISSKIIVK